MPFFEPPHLRGTVGGGSGITELTGDVTAGPGTGVQAATIPNNSIGMAKLNASGTADSTTYLRGDGQWSTVSGGSGLTHPQVLARGLGA
jgi:hypothetical protein